MKDVRFVGVYEYRTDIVFHKYFLGEALDRVQNEILGMIFLMRRVGFESLPGIQKERRLYFALLQI